VTGPRHSCVGGGVGGNSLREWRVAEFVSSTFANGGGTRRSARERRLVSGNLLG